MGTLVVTFLSQQSIRLVPFLNGSNLEEEKGLVKAWGLGVADEVPHCINGLAVGT